MEAPTWYNAMDAFVVFFHLYVYWNIHRYAWCNMGLWFITDNMPQNSCPISPSIVDKESMQFIELEFQMFGINIMFLRKQKKYS
jgi:hypothetical protein